ncbi:origin recognition complex subunit 1 [Protopterus annectens]|uniref:origin recognition complex subunit 1 n=1 Tax=Protopterus annectens TaxID=7888 RepID=UPI001CFABEFF|nr:origin recognition complex subunit 1 [Protopterus annectens]
MGTEVHRIKRAVVQWFVRFEEIPAGKRKLLSRDPDPHEIFLYDVGNCDNDINAETIIGDIKVVQLSPDQVFQKEKNEHVLFVKLSWNGKAFKPLTKCMLPSRNGSSPMQEIADKVSQQNSLKLNFCSPKDGSCDFDIIPTSAACSSNKASHSLTESKNSDIEIESKHSASKHSHSKDRSSLRAATKNSTPGARKKLQLTSPSKSPGSKLTRQDVLAQLFDDDAFVESVGSTVAKRKVAFDSCDSPTKKSLDSQSSEMSNHCISPTSQKSSVKESTDLIAAASTKLRKATPGKARSRDAFSSIIDGICELKNHEEEDCTDADQLSKTRNMTTPAKHESTSKKGCRSSTRIKEMEDTRREIRLSSSKTCRKSVLKGAAHLMEQISILNDSSEDEDEDFSPDSCSSEEEDEEQEEDAARSKIDQKKKSHQGHVPSTPKSSQKSSVSITPNRMRTPRTPKTPHNATPRIPCRNQPVRKPGSVLEEARARLHVSAVPESLPCREQEFQDVYNFVESKLIDGTGGCMYISGVPGTGKTATVHEVIRCLQHASEQDELPAFQFIEINGMKLTDPHQAYAQILKMLTGQKATADHAAALLEKRFSTPSPKRETAVLLVDELDLLWTRKQNVMYNLFDWPTRKSAKLVVLAIANTMDLPERIMINRVSSRLGLTRMSFQPYTYKQLQQIITSRLNRLKAFEDDAIQLVSRKVAALSGDARRCLDICRRATEICELTQSKGTRLVGMVHVMEALDEMFSSPFIMAIRTASVQEQMFLRAIIAEFRRLGLEEATFQQVYQQHISLCRIEGLQPPTMSETMAVCLRLGASRLLLTESSKNDLHMRVRLNVSQDDIMYALKEE